jgi:hypothetical protein
MNDITKYGGDGWDDLPDDSGTLLRGAIIKFNSGEFISEKRRLDGDETWAVTGVLALWVLWGDRAPLQYDLAKPGHGLSDRNELGHLDPERWPLGLDGRPQDPWRDSRYVYLVNTRSAADATFTTDTIGGRRGVSELRNSIANVRLAQPGAIPIVKLISLPMPTKFGIKTRPGFEVLDWKVPDRIVPIPNRAPVIMQPAQASLPQPSQPDLDDEIPF